MPAAVDLLFHSNETEQVSLTTGLEYGMEQQNGKWNGKWNGLLNTQLQLTCVTSAAYSVS